MKAYPKKFGTRFAPFVLTNCATTPRRSGFCKSLDLLELMDTFPHLGLGELLPSRDSVGYQMVAFPQGTGSSSNVGNY